MSKNERLEELKKNLANWIYWNNNTQFVELGKEDLDEVIWLVKEYEKIQAFIKKLEYIYACSDLEDEAKLANFGHELGFDTDEEKGDPYEPTPPNEYGM